MSAKLLSSYSRDVIANLTWLVSARPPLTGAPVGWEPAPAHAQGRSFSSQSVVLAGAPDARVVAVQDGRIVSLGRSSALGRFVVLQDVYGDEFTYAGLGTIAAGNSRPGPAAARRPAIDVSQAV